MTIFCLVFAGLVMFALCTFVCQLFGDVPENRVHEPTEKGCWEGGAGVERVR